MVYIIEAKTANGSLFKIGTTGNCPYKRLGQLKRQNASELKLVAALMGDTGDEQSIHGAFRDFRLHGEWFKDCSGIRRFIEDFSIDQWNQTMQDLEWGRIEFPAAYEKLTLLKYEVNIRARAKAFKRLEKMAKKLRPSLK
jgi:hypothetical protein